MSDYKCPECGNISYAYNEYETILECSHCKNLFTNYGDDEND